VTRNPLTQLRGFSLIELLVAICVLSIVATILVPVMSSLQFKSEAPVATQMQSELDNTYANWKASGGTVTGSGYPATADLLKMLTSIGGAPATPIAPHNGFAGLSDSGNSSSIRLSSSGNGTTISQAVAPIAGTSSAGNPVVAGSYLISFNGTGDSFVVAALDTGWTLVGNPYSEEFTVGQTMMTLPFPAYGGGSMSTPLACEPGASEVVYTQKNGTLYQYTLTCGQPFADTSYLDPDEDPDDVPANSINVNVTVVKYAP